METKDIITTAIAILGWVTAITQFILNRRNQKHDKALEKRFEVYSSFMNKMDEISQSMRINPNLMLGINSQFLSKMLTGDEQQINQALIDFNDKIQESVKASMQPLLIVSQELNKLKLICSNDMLPKIETIKTLSSDFANDINQTLGSLSLSNVQNENNNIQGLIHSERTQQFTSLWKEIEQMMRNEIGYYSKK